MNQRKAGAVLSYTSMGIHSLIGFIYIPMLLLFLNKEQFGLYQLVGSMIAYLLIMDFGLANTTTRYYCAYLANGEKEKQENLLATMLILYGVISALIIAAGIIFFHFLTPFYYGVLSSADILNAKKMFYILLFNAAITVPSNIFTAIINSRERFIFARCLNICNTVIQPALVYAALHFSPNVITVVVMQTICNIFVIAANAYYCLSTLKVKFKLHFWDKNFICELFFFSFFIFLAMIVNEAYWRTGQIILGAVIGTAAVAVYSITVQLASAFMSFSSAVSGVFFPHLSAISAKTDDMKPINEIFIKIGRIQFIIISLVFSGFLIYGKQFVILWIGDGFKDAYFYAVILFSALLIPVVQNTGVFILQAKNKHYFRSIALFCLAVVNIIISIPMAKKYGGLGCACVTGGCILLGQGLILNIYYSKIGIDIKSFFKNIIFMAPPALIVCLTGFAVERFFLTADVYALAGKIILFSALFFALMYKFAFNQYEKNLFLTPAFYIINRIKKAKS